MVKGTWRGSKKFEPRLPLRKKVVVAPTLPPGVIRQNRLRKSFEALRETLNLRASKEIGSGVDYVLFAKQRGKTVTTKIDFKFSFGALGDNIIKARMRDGKLINTSDYIFALGADGRFSIFPTSALAEYVRKVRNTRLEQHTIHKGTYVEIPVNLQDLFSRIRVEVQHATLDAKSLRSALITIQYKRFGILPQQPHYEYAKLGKKARPPRVRYDPPLQDTRQTRHNQRPHAAPRHR